jgi:hypothetical protein
MQFPEALLGGGYSRTCSRQRGRHCHAAVPQWAAGPVARARLAREKLLERMGGRHKGAMPVRLCRAWRKRYLRLAQRLHNLSGTHYDEMRRRLTAER